MVSVVNNENDVHDLVTYIKDNGLNGITQKSLAEAIASMILWNERFAWISMDIHDYSRWGDLCGEVGEYLMSHAPDFIQGTVNHTKKIDAQSDDSGNIYYDMCDGSGSTLDGGTILRRAKNYGKDNHLYDITFFFKSPIVGLDKFRGLTLEVCKNKLNFDEICNKIST